MPQASSTNKNNKIPQKSLENKDISFVVVIIPTKEQVDVNLFREIVEKSGGNVEDYDLDKSQREIKEILEFLEIDYIDLLPILREENIDNTFYFETNIHFNLDGYERVKEIVYENIQEKIWKLSFL